MKKFLLPVLALTIFAAAMAVAISSGERAYGFGNIVGSCEPDCMKCHTLTKDEAAKTLKELAPAVEVLEVRPSSVKGLWEVAFKAQGRVGVVYMDFSKGNIIQGPILNVKSKTDVTSERVQELSKIDASRIPLKEALLMGSADAKYKVIVFDDPD